MKYVVLPLVSTTFATWCVFLGGLAALQQDCYDNSAPGTACMRSYRLPWFVMSFEFAIIVLLALAFAVDQVHEARTSLVSIYTIGLVLFVLTTDSLLTTQHVEYFKSGTPLNIIRTITAGSIMTATMNAICMVVLGYNPDARKGAWSASHSMDAGKGRNDNNNNNNNNNNMAGKADTSSADTAV